MFCYKLVDRSLQKQRWENHKSQPYAPAAFTPGDIPGTHFCYTLCRPQGHSAAERIMLMKNSNDTIGNRTRYRIVAQCLNQLRHRVPQADDSTVYLYTYMDTNLMSGRGFPSTKQGSTAVWSLRTWMDVCFSNGRGADGAGGSAD